MLGGRIAAERAGKVADDPTPVDRHAKRPGWRVEQECAFRQQAGAVGNQQVFDSIAKADEHAGQVDNFGGHLGVIPSCLSPSGAGLNFGKVL